MFKQASCPFQKGKPSGGTPLINVGMSFFRGPRPKNRDIDTVVFFSFGFPFKPQSNKGALRTRRATHTGLKRAGGPFARRSSLASACSQASRMSMLAKRLHEETEVQYDKAWVLSLQKTLFGRCPEDKLFRGSSHPSMKVRGGLAGSGAVGIPSRISLAIYPFCQALIKVFNQARLERSIDRMGPFECPRGVSYSGPFSLYHSKGAARRRRAGSVDQWSCAFSLLIRQPSEGLLLCFGLPVCLFACLFFFLFRSLAWF